MISNAGSNRLLLAVVIFAITCMNHNLIASSGECPLERWARQTREEQEADWVAANEYHLQQEAELNRRAREAADARIGINGPMDSRARQQFYRFWEDEVRRRD